MRSIARASLVRWTVAVLLGAALAVGSTNVAPGRAAAQCAVGPTCAPVQSMPKGTIGLGLMGAELGLIIPALAGMRDWWPYLVFPVLGAAGGAVGGYFLDVEMDRTRSPEVGVALMAIGMALVVPAVIGTLALTAYAPPAEAASPDEDMEYDAAPEDSVEAVQDDTSAEPAPAEAAPAPAESSPQSRLEQRIRDLYAGGPGLFRFHAGQLLLGVPMVASSPTFTREELDRLHLQQQTDVSIPVVSATF